MIAGQAHQEDSSGVQNVPAVPAPDVEDLRQHVLLIPFPRVRLHRIRRINEGVDLL
jgi:hypothetical protein